MRIFPLLLLLLLGNSLFAQKNNGGAPVQVELHGADKERFHNLYFEAVKEFELGHYAKSKEKLLQCVKLTPDAGAYHLLAKCSEKLNEKDLSVEYAKNAYSMLPDNLDLLDAYLNLLNSARQFSEAAVVLEAWIDKHGEKTTLANFITLADFYLFQNKVDDALKVYNRVDEKYGVTEVSIQQKVKIYTSKRQFDNAELELKKLISKYPERMEFNFQLAEMYMDAGKTPAANELYRAILAKSPSNARANISLGENLYISNQRAEAMPFISKAIRNPGLSFDAKVQLMNHMARKSTPDTSDLRLAHTLCRLHPEQGRAYARLAETQLTLKMQPEAVENLKKALDIEPNNYSMWQQLLSLLYDNNDFGALKSSSSEAVDLYPSQPIFYLFQGMAQMELKEFDDAIAVLEAGQAYILDKQDLKKRYYLLLADCYQEIGQFRESDSYLDRLLKINANDALTLNNYAYFLSMRKARLDEAETMAQKAIQLEPDNASYADTYGWVLFCKGSYDKALVSIRKAAELEPDNAEIFHHLGDVYFKLNQPDKALENWQKAQSLGDQSGLLKSKIDDKKWYEK